MRKIILSVLGLVLIALSVFAAKAIVASGQKQRPKPNKVIKTVFADTVVNTTVPITIAANGNLRAQRRVELYSEVQGVLKMGKKLFKAGQIYRKGETLLRLDASEYFATVQSQKSNLYNQIAAIMPDLRLDYPEAFSNWQAYLNAFDIDKPTPELPTMTSEKEKYFINNRNIVTSFYNIKNLEQRLGKYRITAPFSGILTEALVTEGSLVRPGQKLGEFIDTDVYELQVAISKSYAGLLQIGNIVELKSLDTEKTYNGKVTRINGNIDQASQTIDAFIEVRDKSLREGIYLEANLTAKEEPNAISIDRGLLQPDDKLFVVRDSILATIDVKPVFFSEKKVVLKNVPDGTVVMSRPLPGAYPGMLVKVYSEKVNTEPKIN